MDAPLDTHIKRIVPGNWADFAVDYYAEQKLKQKLVKISGGAAVASVVGVVGWLAWKKWGK